MKTCSSITRRGCVSLVPLLAMGLTTLGFAAENSTPQIGVAARDITPELPIRLAGYAWRKRPADKVDHPLLVQALALKNPSGERFVF